MEHDARTNPTSLAASPDGWWQMQIEDLCERVASGGTPSRQRPEFFENGIFSWFKTKELKDCALYESEERITQDALNSSSAKLFPPDTVLMAMYGDGITITSLGILRREAATNQACCAMIPKPTVCVPRFLFYSLLHHREDFIRIASGGAQRSLSGGLIRRFALNTPPLGEQRAIAEVLGALDDKIELNRRMNATLEAMARALFQSWFVDFDPVRANIDGRQITGVDPVTANLFPDRFHSTAFGQVPYGWTISPVGDVVDCVGGGTPSTAEPKYWEGGSHHWTTPKDFSSLQSPILLDTSRKITDAGIAKISSGLLPAGTLLLSSRAPVGYLAIAAMPVAINQGFIAIKCNERASNFFMLNWCQSNMAEIESRATGTTFAEISKQNFRPIPLILPSKELMATFTEKVSPLYARITANLQQSRTLAALRDTLLPRLLSGELRVAEVQHASEVHS